MSDGHGEGPDTGGRGASGGTPTPRAREDLQGFQRTPVTASPKLFVNWVYVGDWPWWAKSAGASFLIGLVAFTWILVATNIPTRYAFAIGFVLFVVLFLLFLRYDPATRMRRAFVACVFLLIATFAMSALKVAFEGYGLSVRIDIGSDPTSFASLCVPIAVLGGLAFYEMKTQK